MRKAIGVISTAFALALVPVAFEANGGSPFDIRLEIQDSCAQAQGDCQEGGFFMCLCGPNDLPKHECVSGIV